MITKPSFTFGYYRPWNENVNWYESWLDYNRDNQRSQYVSQMIVNGVKEVNTENITCLRKINSSLCTGFEKLQNELQSIDENLSNINSTLEEGFYELKQNQIKQIQLMVATNILLVDLKTLISFSDSEKERYESIREGLKFISNVHRDYDYYEEAYVFFSKAKELKPTDYFSLFFLGYISLFNKKYFDPYKAIEYFKKTLKYALIDDNKDIKVLNNFYSKIDEGFSGANLINSTYLFLSQSYYLIGEFENALQNSILLSEDSFSSNFIYQLKYAARANDKKSIMSITDKIFKNYLLNYEDVFTEIDIINNLFCLEYFNNIIQEIENTFIKLKSKYQIYEDNYEIIKKLKVLFSKSMNIMEKKVFIDTYDEIIIDSEIAKQIDFEKFADEELSKIESNYSEFLKIKQNNNSTKAQIRSKINSLTESRNSIKDYLKYILIGYVVISISALIYFFMKNESIAEAIGQNIVIVIVELIIGLILFVFLYFFGEGIEKILEYGISKKRNEQNLLNNDLKRKIIVTKIKEAKKNLEYYLKINSKYDYAKAYIDRFNDIRF